MVVNFDETVSHWGKLAPQLYFLGEIALSKSETINHLKALRSRLEVNDYYSTYAVPITVLAVNCAYYYYDDRGFWKHFCGHLHLANNAATQSNLGDIIEGYLRKLAKNSFDERSGPFRYVSRILEQCGVSQHYMKQFADAMKFIKRQTSWETISSLSHDEYKKCIPDDLPKFLHQFLKDISGWHFVIAVAHNMSQYEHKLLDNDGLCSLSGYRPGFWENFLHYFNGTVIKTPLYQYRAHSYGYIEPPFLYWQDNNPPQCPDFVNSKYVYMKPFGKICVGNFDSLLAGRYIFVRKVAGKTSLVPINLLQKNTDKVASLELDKLEITTPCELELWFETTGRTPGMVLEKQISKRMYVLIDKISIETYPQRLLAPEESLRITLRGPQNYHLRFPQPVTKNDHKKEWMIPCDSSQIDGDIMAGALSIPVEIPVYRDMLRMESGSKILLSSQKDMEENIVIEGEPGSQVKLVIENNTEKQTVEMGARFGGEGHISLGIKNDLRMAIGNWQGSWGLISQGTGTLVGSILYLNLPVFMKDIASLRDYPDAFFNALPEKCSKSFKQLASLPSVRDTLLFDAGHITEFPEKLQNILWILAACAKVFEGTNILNLEMQNERTIQQIPSETRKALLWYLKARDIHTAEKAEELSVLFDTPVKPEAVYAPRWIEMVRLEQQRISQLNSLITELSQQLTEWIVEVTGIHRQTYDSVIANLPCGKELTIAWGRFYYYRKRWHDAHFSEIFDRTRKPAEELGIVGALARILQLAVLKESDRKHLMKQIAVANIPNELFPAVQHLLDGTADAGVLAGLLSSDSTQ